jgi:putative tricarboxylic transport membrane protein
MKLHDRVAGLLIAVAGAALVLHARTFPSMPGQRVGPALFPILIGVGLLICAAVLLVSGFRERSAPWLQVDPWLRRPRMVLNFGLVFADLVFYALAVGSLGFHLTAVIFLSILMLAFEVPRARILPLALVVAVAIHYGFYGLLRVPLPWGLLEGLAW